VVVALPGVQRFIAEARSTSDVRAASQIFVRLAGRAAEVCQDAGGELVFPSAMAGADSMPNRVVALFPPGAGPSAARRVEEAVHERWRGWLRDAVPRGDAGTPGMPIVHWVCMPPAGGGYPGQWQEAQRLLAARRRVRDFEAVEWRRRVLCSLGPRWPAADPPSGLRPHEQATLSAAGWVKRRWHKLHGLDGFPSTSSRRDSDGVTGVVLADSPLGGVTGRSRFAGSASWRVMCVTFCRSWAPGRHVGLRDGPMTRLFRFLSRKWHTAPSRGLRER
jgi:CRISPR-associated protein Cmr2